MNETLGMIGLGNAGSALAGALTGRRALIGYDANPARRAALAALDLRWAASVAELFWVERAAAVDDPNIVVRVDVHADYRSQQPVVRQRFRPQGIDLQPRRHHSGGLHFGSFVKD